MSNGTATDRKQPKATDAGSDRGERSLGVIEALVAVRDQCPHGAVRQHAAAALEKVSQGGSEALRHQAFLVLSTIGGWRGTRAEAVQRTLRSFLASTEEK